MDRETARQTIKERIKCTEFLKKAPHGGYICPKCGSGTGTHGTGGVKYYKDTNLVFCHTCQKQKVDKSWDVIDLYMMVNSCDYNTALSDLAAQIGITIDRYRPDGGDAPRKAKPKPKPAAEAEPARDPEAEPSEPEREPANYTEYYKWARGNLDDPAALAYLASRGISRETAEAYWIGFDPAADPASAPGAMGDVWKPHPCPRLIMPTSKSHYVGRSIDPTIEPGYKALNSKGSEPGIFNQKALFAKDAKEVFVCEGVMDALSIIEAGSPAVALNSANNGEILIQRLKAKKPTATLILSFDNDEKGQYERLYLGRDLNWIGIHYTVRNVSGDHKDPNEALQADREKFFEAVRKARQEITKPDCTAYYIDNLMWGEIERFRGDRKTGFADLDSKTGGLYPGLYVLAAISSLGKTSFGLQLADQLAENGNDVIFFSLEMSRLELVTKSIARRTAQADPMTAVRALSIRKGYLPEQVHRAADEYKAAVSDRLSIVEGNFNCNIDFIGDYIRDYMETNKTRPVVFVDYLQILRPSDKTQQRQTTKEMVDSTVTELKRISRDLDLTVFIVSSVNRANYLTPFDFESLKESGGIEYTADVVWGLQLQCLREDIFSQQSNIKEKRERVQEAKAENPRKIELVCVKNRYGISSYSCLFDYYPEHDLFKEDSGGNIWGQAKTSTKRSKKERGAL